MTEDNPNPPPPTPTPAQPLDYSGGSTGYPGPYVGPPPSKDDKTMAMLAHLLSIFFGFLGPLIIWLMKKDQSPFVDDQGKESLNFQLAMLIAWLVGGATICLGIGALIIAAAWLATIIFGIMGAMKANEGVAYRYPFNIRFIK